VATYHDLDAVLPGRDITLRYRDWGGAGTPIVLAHGLASSLTIWNFVAPILAERFRVVAIDQRGHGMSSKPEEGYGFEEVGADLASFIQQTGLDRPVIVGHSWGGSVAVRFGVDYPQMTRGLVLVDGGFIDRSKDVTWEEAEEEMRPPDIDGAPVERFMQMMQQWPSIRDSWSEELGKMILYNFDVRDGKIYRRLSIPNHMKIARAIFEQRASELLAIVQAPVLVVPALREPQSEAERRWQEYRQRGIEAIKAARPNIRVHPMEDSIHDVPIQRPQELAAAIADFAGTL
jgi:pimeloyl-ACP methyl ester carboxylesterase